MTPAGRIIGKGQVWLGATTVLSPVLLVGAVLGGCQNDKPESLAPPSEGRPERSVESSEPPKPSTIWARFSPPQVSWSIEFPGEPESEFETLDTTAGPLGMSTFTAATEEGVFTLMYADYPPDSIGDATAVLDGARDGAVAEIGGTLSQEKNISLGQHPGKSLLITVPEEDLALQMHLYLVENRLIQLIVSHERNAPPQGDARFLGSLLLGSAKLPDNGSKPKPKPGADSETAKPNESEAP